MAYPKKSGRGYSNNQNSRQSGGNAQRKKKHSGATHGVFKTNDGGLYTTGWNYSSRHGLVKFFCKEYAKSTHSTSQKGNEYITVICEVTKPMCPKAVTFGLMDVRTGQVVLKDMGIVINPKAPNGGYCGKFGTK